MKYWKINGSYNDLINCIVYHIKHGNYNTKNVNINGKHVKFCNYIHQNSDI